MKILSFLESGHELYSMSIHQDAHIFQFQALDGFLHISKAKMHMIFFKFSNLFVSFELRPIKYWKLPLKRRLHRHRGLDIVFVFHT